jgi:hypothetical protein
MARQNQLVLLTAGLLLGVAGALVAQEPSGTAARDRGARVTVDVGDSTDSAAAAVTRELRLPAADRFTQGSRVIAAGDTVAGTVAVSKGTLDVRGVVTGDAVAVDGDVVVHDGGLVRGDAIAVRGRVRLEGGAVLGELRHVTTEASAAAVAAPARSPWQATTRAVGLALGWLAVLIVIGFGVMIFAGEYLDGVTGTLERRFARSLWVGLLAQLALLPGLLLLIVGLALTIIGLLLIPFAIVAYLLAVAGLLTLGFLAVARMTGTALTGRGGAERATPRAVVLRALVTGLLFYLGFWLVAGAFAWSPLVFAILTGVAGVVTWVALTAGLGATILSRAGVRRGGQAPTVVAPADDLGWQTPTPVSGVVAARRPTPAPRTREPR